MRERKQEFPRLSNSTVFLNLESTYPENVGTLTNFEILRLIQDRTRKEIRSFCGNSHKYILIF
ncbi:hypothetical protein DLM78_10145 [Leptospira stimsonii]|uniref:Uncharacterized protein n=1 Tax=Leptospira stimsonii TaxID=2202203 RepID=A0A8B3CQG7_9LEPT|nr:hypothetical protein DLM78_10145 [Leptospira stimsonii]